MTLFAKCRFAAALIALAIAAGAARAQETDGSHLAIEFPELNSGLITSMKSYITRADVNTISFWILNPAAESIDSGKVVIRINGKAAIRICAEKASSKGKVMKCDLNRLFGFRLYPKENALEIEALGRDGKRYFRGFNVFTNPAAALAQNDTKESSQQRQTSALGFSGRKFAVILGVSKYKYNDGGLGNLAYADADADALHKWLTNDGGFDPMDVLYITNQDATLAFVRDALTRFLTKATETDLVVFYFAGHGSPDPYDPSNLYYIVHDSKVSDLKGTGFRMSDLKTILDKNLRSKRAIFLLDTCHSAGVSAKKVVVSKATVSSQAGTKGRELTQVDVPNNVSATAEKLFGSPGRAILTSSDVGESSLESPQWGGGHGVFTWAILEGLRGKADRNRDRLITSDELFEFTQEYVRSATNGRQNPRVFSTLGAGLELTRLK